VPFLNNFWRFLCIQHFVYASKGLSSFYTHSLSPASSSLHRDAVILQGFEEESERFISKLHGFGARTLQYCPNAHQATAQHISVGVYKLINEIKSIISSKKVNLVKQ